MLPLVDDIHMFLFLLLDCPLSGFKITSCFELATSVQEAALKIWIYLLLRSWGQYHLFLQRKRFEDLERVLYVTLSPLNLKSKSMQLTKS
jgi:hypothetical protein